MSEYPKIETLFDRDETFNVIDGQVRLPEFALVNKWQLTEKIDGTNVRVIYAKGEKMVPMILFCGRTEKAQMPTFLLKYLQEIFTLKKLATTFPDLPTHGDNTFTVVLYGEGYGAKIQKGGNYRPDSVAFRLFDVKVEKWWLQLSDIADVATKLGIKTVPYLGEFSFAEAWAYVKAEPYSIVAQEEGGNRSYLMEGVVARTEPLLLRRNGERLMWKLKRSDYHKGRK